MDFKINRLSSMVVDHIVMTVIQLPVIIIAIGIVLGIDLIASTDEGPFEIGAFYGTILMFSFTVYFLKDSYRGRSIGKRLIGLQIIDRKTGKPASSLQCFVRNLLTPLWMIEVIVIFISPTIRIGDLLARTAVIPAEKESSKSLWNEIKKTKFKATTVLIVVAIGSLYSFGLAQLMFLNYGS